VQVIILSGMSNVTVEALSMQSPNGTLLDTSDLVSVCGTAFIAKDGENSMRATVNEGTLFESL